jgi:hypothetical protein
MLMMSISLKYYNSQWNSHRVRMLGPRPSLIVDIYIATSWIGDQQLGRACRQVSFLILRIWRHRTAHPNRRTGWCRQGRIKFGSDRVQFGPGKHAFTQLRSSMGLLAPLLCCGLSGIQNLSVHSKKKKDNQTEQPKAKLHQVQVLLHESVHYVRREATHGRHYNIDMPSLEA